MLSRRLAVQQLMGGTRLKSVRHKSLKTILPDTTLSASPPGGRDLIPKSLIPHKVFGAQWTMPAPAPLRDMTSAPVARTRPIYRGVAVRCGIFEAFRTNRRALFTASSLGKALASSGSRMTTFVPTRRLGSKRPLGRTGIFER